VANAEQSRQLSSYTDRLVVCGKKLNLLQRRYNQNQIQGYQN
jgi:hypothetical protein